MYHTLVQARDKSVSDDIGEVVVCHVGRDIDSVDIRQVFLASMYIREITDLPTISVWHVAVTTLFSNQVLALCLCIMPEPVSFPPFQYFVFCN